MKQIVNYLKDSKIQFLATTGLDDKPKVRPFQFMFEDDGKLWFCTSNKKEVYKELSNQPYIELCCTTDNTSWLRLSGKVNFENNLKVKELIMLENPLVKSIYQEATNKDFEVLYITEGVASLSSIGKPAQTISF